jgi:prophage regulatory protein
MADRILRERDVRTMTGLSRSTRWRLERAGMFPRKRRLSPGAVGWFESEVADWLASRTEQPGAWRGRLAA